MQTPPDRHQLLPPQPPPWLSALLTTPFYTPCPAHAHLRRADLNLFDTHTSTTSCQHCAASPAPHSAALPRHLHISRYMYHAVILLSEAAHHLPVAGIQPYLNNGSRVLYLDRSTQPKSRLAPHASSCKICARTLQHPYVFCALRCALQAAHVPLPPPRAVFVSAPAPAPAPAPASAPAPALALPTSPLSTPASTPQTSPLPPLLLPVHSRIAKPAPAPKLALPDEEPHKPRSRRKSRPTHSPAPGPGSFVLLRAALQPLAL